MEKRVIIIVGIIIFLAIISRIIFLDLRPLHHDEGVNYFFAKNIVDGVGFSYDPLNYHGPFYFFIVALSFILFGISEFSLRLPAVLFGIALAILPIFLKFKDKLFDKFGKYIVAIFIILSPSLFYYSRYSIHEISLVLFSFLCVYFLTLILEKKNFNYLPYLAICFALLFAIKETVFLLGVVFLVFLVFNFKKISKLPWKKYRITILFSIIVFFAIYLMLFTSFFYNMKGFSDSFKSLISYENKGINEGIHNKPVYYYLLLFLNYELPIFLLGLLGIFYAFKSKSIFYKNIALWGIVIFIVYSIIPYKVPWLIINITLPFCFLAGISAINIYKKFRRKKFLMALFAICILYLVWFAFSLNFLYPWQSENKFAYAHTDKDILRMVKVIKNSYNASVLIYSKDYWPLPFYIKGANYQSSETKLNYSYLKNYNYIILDKNTFSEVKPYYKNYSSYTLRNGVKLFLVRNF